MLAAAMARAVIGTDQETGSILEQAPDLFVDVKERNPAAQSLDLALGVPSTETQLLIEGINGFAERELVPNIREWEKVDSGPPALVEAFQRAGLLGLSAPEFLGGLGLSKTEYAHAVIAMARHYPAAALSFLAAHTSLCTGNILQSGNEELIKRFVPLLASGEAIGAWAFTEPHGGSKTFADMHTRVRFDGDNLIVNGGKIFITNGNIADVLVAYGITEDREMISFVIDGSPEGLIRRKIKKQMMCASDTAELKFENVTVPIENILARGDETKAQLFRVLNNGRMVIASHALGIMEAVIESAERIVQDQDNAHLEPVQARIQRMKDAYLISSALTFQVAALLDKNPENPDIPDLAALAKYVATENADRVADLSAMLHGGYAVDPEHRVLSFRHDAFILRVGEGSNHSLLGYLEKREAKLDDPNRRWATMARELVLSR